MGQTGGFAASSWLVRQVASLSPGTQPLSSLAFFYKTYYDVVIIQSIMRSYP